MKDEIESLKQRVSPEELRAGFENQRKLLQAIKQISEEGTRIEKRPESIQVKVSVTTNNEEVEVLNVTTGPPSLLGPQEKSSSQEKKTPKTSAQKPSSSAKTESKDQKSKSQEKSQEKSTSQVEAMDTSNIEPLPEKMDTSTPKFKRIIPPQPDLPKPPAQRDTPQRPG